jgi:hypothetical protein
MGIILIWCSAWIVITWTIHYKNIVLSLEERREYWEAAMWSELAAPEHRFKKYGLELPQLPKDYGQMILLPI